MESGKLNNHRLFFSMLQMIRITRVGIAVLSICVAANSAAAQKQAVTFDVYAETGGQASAMHEWAAALQQLGLGSVQIQSIKNLPEPAIDRDSSGHIRITAILTSRNQLHLPGLRLELQQASRIRDWVNGLSVAPEPSTAAPPLAFGMTAEQLVRLRRTLSQPLGESSLSKSPPEVLRRIRKLADLPIRISATATNTLRQPFQIEDELETVSIGTAMAAVLRPLGLAMVPSVRNQAMEITIMPFSETEEFWPVGWPIDKPAKEIAPRLYEFLPVDIEDVAVSDAVSALRTRLKLPLLFDHNGMARHGIRLDGKRVTVAPTRTYYKRALERVLYPARLKVELRMDETGNPFLWIAPNLAAPQN